MHDTARQYGEFFFKTYSNNENNLVIIEIGSQNINGSLREVAPKNSKYIGLDFAEGNGVDIVLDNPYKYPFEDEYADMVVMSSCIEHSQFFWKSYMEALRILKPKGLLYVNSPSNGNYHTYPTDNWRFYPDASKALASYAKSEGYDTEVLESFIAKQQNDIWNDFIAIFIKDDKFSNLYNKRIYNSFAKELGVNNIWLYKQENILNRQDETEDRIKLRIALESLEKSRLVFRRSILLILILVFIMVLLIFNRN